MKCIPYYFLKNNRATWPIDKRSTPSKMECKDKLNANKTHKINPAHARSEEHTSELQSRGHLVCRLLLEKKKTKKQSESKKDNIRSRSKDKETSCENDGSD